MRFEMFVNYTIFFSKTNVLFILHDRSRGKAKPRKIRKTRRSSTLFIQAQLFKD